MVEAKDYPPSESEAEGVTGSRRRVLVNNDNNTAFDHHETDSIRAVDCSSDGKSSSIEESLCRLGGKKRRRSDTSNMTVQDSPSLPNEPVGDENVLQPSVAPLTSVGSSGGVPEQQMPLPPPPPPPGPPARAAGFGWWQKPKAGSSYSNLRGLPCCSSELNEHEFAIENFPARKSSTKPGEKLYGPIHEVAESGIRFRLMIFPCGTSEGVRQGCISAFIEVLPPREGIIELMGENDRLTCWRYSEVIYYIAAIDWTDWTRSRVSTDRFAFNDAETDRGWHSFLKQEHLGDYIGGSDQRLVFRYALVSQGLQYQTTETRRRYRGLRNHGTTCYLNSLLQCLFYVGGFRGSVWEMTKPEDREWLRERRRSLAASKSAAAADNGDMAEAAPPSDSSGGGAAKGGGGEIDDPMEEEFTVRHDEFDNRSWTEEEIQQVLENPDPPSTPTSDTKSSMPRALQRVFYNLAQGQQDGWGGSSGQQSPVVVEGGECLGAAASEFGPDAPVQCKDLLASFGFDHHDQFMQHDAQELNRLLCDRLEERMKGTPAEGTIKRLFAGESEVYIECTDVDYKSSRMEVFYDLQLQVQQTHCLEESLDQYVREEILEGDNCYQAEGHGPQRAKKGTRFHKLPPVLQFHLKRFEFDVSRMEMVKVNDLFKFPEKINFDKWCPGAGNYRLFAVDVHHGEISEGHYYSFVRAPGPNFGGSGAAQPHRSTAAATAAAASAADDPLADCWWLKFDDEMVYRCDEKLAIKHNYGGPIDQVICPYQSPEMTAEARNNPPCRPYSAYMLFYIKEDIARTILTAPNPRDVNPGMVYRMNLLDREKMRHYAIKREIEGTVKLRFLTEKSLQTADATAYRLPTATCPATNPNELGIWRYPSDVPALMTLKRSKDLNVMALWEEVWAMAERGDLGSYYQRLFQQPPPPQDGTATTPIVMPGLYYFDVYSAQQGSQQARLTNIAQQNGYAEGFGRPDEVGYGLRLWGFIFDDNITTAPTTKAAQQTAPATIRTNLQYLQGGDPLSLKRSTLTVLIHPIILLPSHVRNYQRRGGDPTSWNPRTHLTFTDLHNIHEERSIFPLKIYDPLAPSLYSRRLWFVGFCHLSQQIAQYEQAQATGTTATTTAATTTATDNTNVSPRTLNILLLTHDKIMRAWANSDNSILKKAITASHSPFAQCIDRAAAKYFLVNGGGATQDAARMCATKTSPSWLMYFEYRGMFEQCNRVPEVSRDFRSGCECRVVVASPMGVLEGSTELAARVDEYRASLDAVSTHLFKWAPPTSHPCESLKYYDGGRRFYAALEAMNTAAATANAVRQLLPSHPALPVLTDEYVTPIDPPMKATCPNPLQWMVSLRGVRRIRVQLIDVMAHYGRYELVDGRPLPLPSPPTTTASAPLENLSQPPPAAAATEGPLMEDADTIKSNNNTPLSRTMTPKNVESLGSTSDGGGSLHHIANKSSSETTTAAPPATTVEPLIEDYYPILLDDTIEIDFTWTMSFFMQLLCVTVIRCDPRYTFCYLVPPKETLPPHMRPPVYDNIHRPNNPTTDLLIDEPFPVLLMHETSDTMVNRLVGSMIDQQTKLGLHPTHQAVVGPTKLFDDPPILTLVALPFNGRASANARGLRNLFVRLFDKRLGTLGCVVLPGVNANLPKDDFIMMIKKCVDRDRLSERLRMRGDNCAAPTDPDIWLQQEMVIKEYTHRVSKEVAEIASLNIFQYGTSHSIITPTEIRMEPRDDVSPQHRSATLECIWVDSETFYPFGYPFCVTVKEGECVKDVKNGVLNLLSSSTTPRLPSLQIEFYRSSDGLFREDSRPMPLKDDLVVFDGQTIGWQLLLVTRCGAAEKESHQASRSGSPNKRGGDNAHTSPAAVNRRRFANSLHIRG